MHNNVAMTKEAWDEWLAHPGTQGYRAMLLLWRESLKDQWAAGGLVEPTANSQGLAQVRLLDDLSKMDHDEYLKTMGIDTDETIQTQTKE